MAERQSVTAEAARIAKLRAFFARYVTWTGAVRDPRIEAAFASVPREPFAGPGPWQIRVASPWKQGSQRVGYLETPDDDPAFLYQDVLVALDPARGINIGEPSLHARCLDCLVVQPGETVVQIGAGSGYYSAILATLVGPEGRVHAYEIDPALAERAASNLRHWPQAKLMGRSGTADRLPQADVVYVNAGISHPSANWLEALRPGGRLLFPLQGEQRQGGMLLVEKPRDEASSSWPARFVSRSSFIPCQAEQSTEIDNDLATAFERGNIERVRSIRFGGEPDESCWLAGGSWWLSTAPP